MHKFQAIRGYRNTRGEYQGAARNGVGPLRDTREEAEADLKNFPKKGKLETDGEVFEICTRK